MIDTRSLPSAVALEEVLRAGRVALAAGQVQGAIRTFNEALRIKPTYAPAWRAKGRALRVSGDSKAALECYVEALRYEPDDEGSWFGFALTLHELGRRKDEVTAYDEILRRNPRNIAAWMNRGVALHESHRYEDAIACYDRILAIRPEFAPAWNDRGAALMRLGRLEEALDAFDEALTLDPEFADAAANRRSVLARLKRTEPEPPAITLPEATEFPPSLDVRVRANLGLPAVSAWRRARSEAAEDFVALGTALLEEGAPEGALSAFSRAEKMGAGPVSSLGKFTALRVLNDAAARDEAARIRTEFPDVPRAAILLATLQENAGDLAGAAEALDTLVAERPGLAWAWNSRGLLALRAGDSPRARESFERATAADPTDPDGWSGLAAALHREGGLDDALAACDRALAIDANHAPALNNRGVILVSLGRTEDGEAALENAAKRGDLSIMLNLARHHEMRGRYREALAVLNQILDRNPKDETGVRARRRVLGHIGARERSARGRFLARLETVPGIGPAAARKLVVGGLTTATRIRKATTRDLRELGLSPAQARALKRSFRTGAGTGGT